MPSEEPLPAAHGSRLGRPVAVGTMCVCLCLGRGTSAQSPCNITTLQGGVGKEEMLLQARGTKHPDEPERQSVTVKQDAVAPSLH